MVSQEMGGIRQYAIALLKILSKDRTNRYYVLHDVEDAEIMAILAENPHLTWLKVHVAESARKAFIKKIKRKLLVYYSRIFVTAPEKDPLDDICKKHQIDIIHCPYQYLPQSVLAKSICTMHDVQELHYPEYFTPEQRADRAVNYLKYIKNAEGIIVSYQHIKDDIVNYFEVPEKKVTVCLLDMNNLWFENYGSGDILPLRFLDADERFILYPANTWKHKNHEKLLEALCFLRGNGDKDIKVVCTGHQTAYFHQVLKPFIDAHGLQEQVIFAGVVSEKEMFSLYRKCVGVVVPTLYEAGSFPLMEAILLGVPVICSNVTSLPETIGKDSFVFDPRDTTDISAKLKRLWEDKTYREENITNCAKQAHRLKETGAIGFMLTAYQNALTN